MRRRTVSLRALHDSAFLALVSVLVPTHLFQVLVPTHISCIFRVMLHTQNKRVHVLYLPMPAVCRPRKRKTA
jgi:hypothetical protein